VKNQKDDWEALRRQRKN